MSSRGRPDRSGAPPGRAEFRHEDKQLNLMIRLAAAALLVSFLSQAGWGADDKVVARVDGVEITEADVAAASASLGAELAGIPDAQRRRQIVDYLVTNQLMAAAAAAQKLDSGPAFARRLENYRRLALAETFYQKIVLDEISEAQVKKIYDKYVAEYQARPELRARHILVSTEEEANDIVERLNRGDDFAALAKEFSKGPEAEAGGDIGYFGKGDMVEPFDKAVFALQVNEVSEPVQTQFGWHVIQLVDKRTSKPNAFDDEKYRIMASLIEEKRDSVIEGLRGKAKIEIVDPALKKAMDNPSPRGSFGQ